MDELCRREARRVMMDLLSQERDRRYRSHDWRRVSGASPRSRKSLRITGWRIGDNSRQTGNSPISIGEFDPGPSPVRPEHLLRLSWTHFIELIRIDDPLKRAFYEAECRDQPSGYLQGRKERARAMALVFVGKASKRSTIGQAGYSRWNGRLPFQESAPIPWSSSRTAGSQL